MGDDPNESGSADRPSGPRGSIVILVTLVALAVLGAIAAGAAVWIGRTDDSAGDAPATTADVGIDVEPIGEGTASRLFARRTEAGVEVRVHASDDEFFGGGPPRMAGAPEWCEVVSTAMATAVSADAVAQTQLPIAKQPPPDAAATPLIGGMIEGAPLYGVLAQVGPDVTLARLTVAGGGQDSMEPIDGLVALAVAAPPTDGGEAIGPPGTFGFDPWGDALRVVGIEFLHADGSSERITGQEMMEGRGPPVWSDPECVGGEGGFIEVTIPASTAQLTLPAAGAEPADPAAARAEIESAYDEVHANLANWDTLSRLVDDPSGIDVLMADLPQSVRRRLEGITVEITDLVFFSPVEASFVYRASIEGHEGFPSYGRARLIDGTWRITRSTICQDIANAGTQCSI